MFYSSSKDIIDNSVSYLVHDRIFSGQYWDEFGITAHLIPPGGRVLMLGLAYGGGIKPLLSGDPEIEITAIDLNDETNAECSQIFSDNYPDLRFYILGGDALQFVRETQSQYDAIWVDIYGAQSYLPDILQREFYEDIKRCLQPTGKVFINSYGIPLHLSGFVGPHVHDLLTSQLQKHFQYISVLPYRRNRTFVASEVPLELRSISVPAEVRFQDRLMHEVHRLRLQGLSPVQKRDFVGSVPIKFAEIDQQMREGWKKFVEILNSYLPVGEKLTEVLQLRGLFTKPAVCKSILNQMVSQRDPLQCFFPIFIAGEMNCSTVSADWYLEWFFERALNLFETQKLEFVHYHLPQTLAILLNPQGRYKKYLFRFSELMASLQELA